MTDEFEDAPPWGWRAGPIGPGQAGYQRIDELTAVTEAEIAGLHGMGLKRGADPA